MDLPLRLTDRYELTSHIARGGMADVYEGLDHLLGRRVAIKMLHPQHSTDEAFVKRFRREAQAAANLSHPNIVSIYDWGQFDTTYFIVMELVHGRTLRNVLRTEKVLLPRRAIEITAEVAAALGVAHRAGIVHRDVKPGNILLATDGSVKVTDFGIARAWGDSQELTKTGAVIGTATYFSPEQAQGSPADHRSDLYSLGVVLYEMLTGQPPFRGETPVSVALQHVAAEAQVPSLLNPDVLAEIDAIVGKMMHKDPGQRYQSADELRSQLLRFLTTGTTTATTIGGQEADPGSNATAPSEPNDEPTTAVTSIPAEEIRAGPIQRDPLQPVEEPNPSNLPTVIGAFAILGVLTVLIILMFRFLGSDTTISNQLVEVPDLTNALEATAFERLGDLGLRPVPARQTSGTVEEGRVIDTEPGGGTQVEAGVSVTVYVSAGLEEFSIPLVVGQSEAAAVALLEAQGFMVGEITTEPDSPSPPGTVTSQDPVAGIRVPAGASVSLTVARGPSFVILGDLVDLTEREAIVTLNDLGLTWEVEEEFSEEVEEGRVISSDPAAGSELIPEQVVTLVISIGLSPTEIPNLVGLTPEQAEAALTELGLELRVSSTTERVDDPGLDGRVTSQFPLPGTSIDPGSGITVGLGFWVEPNQSTTSTAPPADDTTTTPPATTNDTETTGPASPDSTEVPGDVEPGEGDIPPDTEASPPDTSPNTTLPVEPEPVTPTTEPSGVETTIPSTEDTTG